jgi:hypothetical protein
VTAVQLTATVLSDGQREVLGQALGDAIEQRTPSGICADCESTSAGLCEPCSGDLDLTDAYLELARELSIEVDL